MIGLQLRLWKVLLWTITIKMVLRKVKVMTAKMRLKVRTKRPRRVLVEEPKTSQLHNPLLKIT